MMQMSKFWIFLTFSMCSNQMVHQKSTNQPKTNKKVATGSEIKLTIHAVHIDDFLMQILEML